MEATAAVSCCRSDEAVSAAGGITMLGVVCAGGAVCGANQPSCGDEFASIALAASPYDCQAKVAPIPMENMIRKRARPREALRPSERRQTSPPSDRDLAERDLAGAQRHLAGAPPFAKDRRLSRHRHRPRQGSG